MDVGSTFEDRPLMYYKSRERTPTTATAATDVNFNSPGHRSSQDGSFIQDDDMHLLLDFGQAKTASDLNQLISNSTSAIVSQSWRGRNAEWATNFDVNVAELDFDDFSASRDMDRLKGARYADATSPDAKIYDLQRSLRLMNENAGGRHGNSGKLLLRSVADCNHNNNNRINNNNNNNRNRIMRNSLLGLGSTGSMMLSSSDGDMALYEDDYYGDHGNQRDRHNIRSVTVGGERDEALILDRCAGALAFISTDSLDLSSLSINEANLNRVCATNKHEYVLTFDKAGYESSVMLDDNNKTFDCIEISGGGGEQEKSEYDNQNSGYYAENNCAVPADQNDDEDYCKNAEDSDDFTTWGRVKRSYEMDRTANRPYVLDVSKCTSLPNLIPSPIVAHGSERFVAEGVEERLRSKIEDGGDDALLRQDMSMSISQKKLFADNNHHATTTTVTLDSKQLVAPPAGQAGSSCSSGYHTGGSSQSNANNKLKLSAKPTATDNNAEDKNTDDNQDANYRPQFVLVNGDDYEYGEFFVNGRYIDVNHNEIGYVPTSTEGLQRSSSANTAGSGTTVWASTVTSRRKSKSGTPPPPSKPPRTFATLLEQQQHQLNFTKYDDDEPPSLMMRNSSTQVPVYVMDQSVQTSISSKQPQHDDVYFSAENAAAVSARRREKYGSGGGVMPDLSFMKFPFTIPPLHPSLSPFLLQFLNASSSASGGNFVGAGDSPLTNQQQQQQPTLNDILNFNSRTGASGLDRFAKTGLETGVGSDGFKLFNQSIKATDGFEPFYVLPDPPKLFSPHQYPQYHFNNQRLDSGFGGSATGPSHIQDWESLATLLPKHVVQACSFFKANTNLLGSIDKPGGRSNVSPRASTKRLCFSTSGFLPTTSSSSSRTKYRGYPQQQSNNKQNVNANNSEGFFRQFRSEPCSLKRCCHSNDGGGRFESIAEENYEFRHYPASSSCCNQRRYHHQQAEDYGCLKNHNSANPAYRNHCDGKCQRKPPQQQRASPHCLAGHSCRYCRCLCDDLSRDPAHATCACRRSRSQSTSSRASCSCCLATAADRHWSQPYAAYAPPMVAPPIGTDPRAFLQSELLCRPDVDLTNVQKFYSLPNVNNSSSCCTPYGVSFHGNDCSSTWSSMEEDAAATAAVPCRTCFRVRSPSTERCYQEFFCDCRTSDVVDHRRQSGTAIFDVLTSRQPSIAETPEFLNERINDIVICCEKLTNAFSQKSTEKCVDLVEDEFFGSAVGALVFNSLCPCVENLLTDGLSTDSRCLWVIVQASVVSYADFVNVQVRNLIRTLGSTEDNPRERSLQFATFINGLLCLRSLDVWLRCVLCNDGLLKEYYSDSSFVRLLDAEKLTYLLESVERLNVLPFERLNLIDVELSPLDDDVITSTDCSDQGGDCRRRRRFTSAEKTNSVVSLQKELRLTFRVPVSLTPVGLFEKSLSLDKSGHVKTPPSESVEAKNFMTVSLTAKQLSIDNHDDDDASATMRRSRSAGGSRMSPRKDQQQKSISNSIDKPMTSSSSKNSSAASTPTKRSRIPLLLKTKTISLTPKSNLNIITTSDGGVARSGNNENSCSNIRTSISSGGENRFTYEKSYVCTTEKVEKAEDGYLTFEFGETLVLLEEYKNGLLKCSRGNNVVGYVSRDKVTYISFL